ncbi:hypothetical protein QUB70_16995 [Microcoleus sp. A003_D6]
MKIRFKSRRFQPNKPGFCPNLWVGKYFVKNPVSRSSRSHFWIDGRSKTSVE